METKIKKEVTMYGWNGFNISFAYCEAKGLSNVFKAYADECSGQTISEIGFNSNTGYVYIALDDSIQICSAFGREVEYLVTNFENGEETFFESYDEALKFLETL